MRKTKIWWFIKSRRAARSKAKQQREIERIGGMSLHSRGIYERYNRAC